MKCNMGHSNFMYYGLSGLLISFTRNLKVSPLTANARCSVSSLTKQMKSSLTQAKQIETKPIETKGKRVSYLYTCSTSYADSGSFSQPREKKNFEEKPLVTLATSQTPTHTSTEAFVTKDQLLESEILWAVKNIMSHYYTCSSIKSTS